jgi:hypothetical protein
MLSNVSWSIFSGSPRSELLLETHSQVVSDPKRMVARIVSLTTHAKLVCHIDIAVWTHNTTLLDPLKITDLHLPRGPAVDALDSIASLTSNPLLEASLVHIVATSSLTPDKVILLLIEIHVTDRALTIDRLALSVVIGCLRAVGGYGRGSLENFLKFGREQTKLVDKVFGCFENGVKGIHLVLAFMAFLRVGAGAGGLFGDGDGVDVARAAHDVDVFGRVLGAVFEHVALAGATDNYHAA